MITYIYYIPIGIFIILLIINKYKDIRNLQDFDNDKLINKNIKKKDKKTLKEKEYKVISTNKKIEDDDNDICMDSSYIDTNDIKDSKVNNSVDFIKNNIEPLKIHTIRQCLTSEILFKDFVHDQDGTLYYCTDIGRVYIKSEGKLILISTGL